MSSSRLARQRHQRQSDRHGDLADDRAGRTRRAGRRSRGSSRPASSRWPRRRCRPSRPVTASKTERHEGTAIGTAGGTRSTRAPPPPRMRPARPGRRPSAGPWRPRSSPALDTRRSVSSDASSLVESGPGVGLCRIARPLAVAGLFGRVRPVLLGQQPVERVRYRPRPRPRRCSWSGPPPRTARLARAPTADDGGATATRTTASAAGAFRERVDVEREQSRVSGQDVVQGAIDRAIERVDRAVALCRSPPTGGRPTRSPRRRGSGRCCRS